MRHRRLKGSTTKGSLCEDYLHFYQECLCIYYLWSREGELLPPNTPQLTRLAISRIPPTADFLLCYHFELPLLSFDVGSVQ